MPKVDIWMPIYIGDYLSDTTELTGPEHGAYLLLLMHYWSKKGEIGSDIERLARVCRSDVETCSFILGYYFTLENGNYRNKRADEEMQIAENRRIASSENGKKGGRPPKNNLEKTDRLIPGNLDESSSSSSSSLPVSTQSEKEEEPFSRESALNANKQSSEQLFQQLKTAWNSNCKPSCNIKSTITMNTKQREDWIAGSIQIVDVFETCKAMQNYGGICSSPEYKAFPDGYSMLGFLVSGVDRYCDEAKPFESMRIKPKTPEKVSSVEVPPSSTTREIVDRLRREASEKTADDAFGKMIDTADTPIARAVRAQKAKEGS